VGPGAACEALSSDGPELAELLAGVGGTGPVARAIGEADLVVAFTRSAPLLDALSARARRLVSQDPAPPPGGPHAARWLARALEPVVGEGAGESDAGILSFTEAERAEAREHMRDLPERFVAIHPGSGSPSKNWPLARFVGAARALAAGSPWLFVAGPAERDAEAPADAVVVREWPLRRLGASLGQAGLFLGNDAGISHLAAAAGAPTLALFGPTDPAVWAPVGPRAATLRAPSGALDDLDLEPVLRAARALRSAESGLPSG
jgi:hypothetical protein